MVHTLQLTAAGLLALRSEVTVALDALSAVGGVCLCWDVHLCRANTGPSTPQPPSPGTKVNEADGLAVVQLWVQVGIAGLVSLW